MTLKEIIDLRDIKQYVGSSAEIENKTTELQNALNTLQVEIWTIKAEAERMRVGVDDMLDLNVLVNFDIEKAEKKCEILEKEIQDLRDFKRFVTNSQDIDIKVGLMENELKELQIEILKHQLKKE